MIAGYVNEKTGGEIHLDGKNTKDIHNKLRKIVEVNGLRKQGWKLSYRSGGGS